MYAFGYCIFKPELTFYRIGHSYQKVLKVLKIPLKRSVMMHDFAITESHAVFLDNPLIFDLSKTSQVGELPFQYEPQHGSRVGIIPLKAESPDEIQWFKLPQSSFVFHTMNAWNEAVDVDGNPEKIEVVVAQYDDMPPFGDLGALPCPFRVRLWKYGLDLITGEVYFNGEAADITDRYDVEFPTVPPKLIGRKTRHGYCSVKDRENQDLMTGFFKVDLDKEGSDAVVGRVFYGEHTTGGEGQFVASLDPNADEDDGHIIFFTNSEDGTTSGATPVSELRIYETKTMSAKPVAVVKIPSLVPFGFHGIFVPKHSLEEQDRLLNLEVKKYSSTSIVRDEGITIKGLRKRVKGAHGERGTSNQQHSSNTRASSVLALT
jgi:carotenoid cleavage dioxygenase